MSYVYVWPPSKWIAQKNNWTSPQRNKNKSRRRNKPDGGPVFKKHENQPFRERPKEPEGEIGEPLPFTEIEGPLIPILKSDNIKQGRLGFAFLSQPDQHETHEL